MTGEDFMASSVLKDHKSVSGGDIVAGETPVSWAFPLNAGQFSLLADWAAAARELVRKRNEMRRRGFIFGEMA